MTWGIGRPPGTQRMQDDVVARAELLSVQHSLIRIPKRFIIGNTPRLVANDALAMLAGTVGAMTIAMEAEGRWRRVHGIVSRQASQEHVRRLMRAR
jgi:hypothetical protein